MTHVLRLTMAKQTLEAATLTVNNDVISMRDSYKKCELLNVIQHIDVYGKIKSSYTENRRRGVHEAAAVSSVSCCSPRFSRHAAQPGVEERLSKLSVTTKVSGLYPGNEILSKKKTRNQRLQQMNSTKDNVVFGSIVTR